jgi:hypothetical protein
MLIFNPIATEQTTAATDLLLGLLAISLVLALQWIKSPDLSKKNYWSLMLCFLAGSSILGALAHGFEMSKTANYIIWYPLYFCLIGVIACFLLGSVHELWRKNRSAKMTPWLLASAFIIYLVTAIPDFFLLFIIYEGLGMLISLGIFIWLFAHDKNKAALWMISGILVTIAAAAAQALGPFQWRLIWEFDHNGLFHLIQIPGIILIFLGIRNSFQIKMK